MANQQEPRKPPHLRYKKGKKTRVTKELKDEIFELRGQKLSFQAIANHFDMCAKVVKRVYYEELGELSPEQRNVRRYEETIGLEQIQKQALTNMRSLQPPDRNTFNEKASDQAIFYKAWLDHAAAFGKFAASYVAASKNIADLNGLNAPAHIQIDSNVTVNESSLDQEIRELAKGLAGNDNKPKT